MNTPRSTLCILVVCLSLCGAAPAPGQEKTPVPAPPAGAPAKPVVAPVQRGPTPAQRALLQARAGMDADALRKAKALYEKVVEDHPKGDEAKYAAAAAAKIGAVLTHGKLEFTPPEAAAVCDAFLKVVEKDGATSAERRAALAEALKAEDPEARADAVRAFLAEGDAAFALAVRDFADERYGPAARQFAAVMKRAREAKRPWLDAAAAYCLARCHIVDERYEDAVPLLDRLTGEAAGCTFHGSDALFMLGVCRARLLDRAVAIAVLSRFLALYEDMPERMQVGALQLIADLYNVSDGDLADIQERMADAGRRLTQADTGKPTQGQQERVVAMLDKIIEKLENPPPGGGGGGGGSGGGNGDAPVPGSGAKESTARASSPNTGPLDRVNRGRDTDTWGRARAKEREEALNVLKARFPERYRELVEQYFRSLQEEAP